MSIDSHSSSSSENTAGSSSYTGSSLSCSIPTQDSTPLTLYGNLEKEIGKFEHRGVDIVDFTHRVWGFDPKDAEKLLAMSPTLDKSLLSSYRQCTHEDDLHSPFLAISKLLLKQTAKELDPEQEGEDGYAFWDRLSVPRSQRAAHGEGQEEPFPDLISLSQPLPQDFEMPSLCIAKHIVEFKRLPRIRKVRKRSVSLVLDASANGDASSSSSPTYTSYEPASHAAKVDRSSTSARKRSFDSVKDDHSHDGSAPKKRRLTELSPLKNCLMALYATEALSSTCRTYVTGLVIDKFDITLCYFDRFLVATSTTFSFEEEPEALALVLHAMRRCDRRRAGFDPHLRHKPFYGTHLQSTDAEATLSQPVPKVVGSYFEYPCSPDEPGDFTFKTGSICCMRVTGMIRKPQDLFSRGTAVYKVRRCLPGGDVSDQLYAFKLSWPPKHRTSEIDVVKYLKEKLPKSCHVHLPDFFFTATFTPEQLGLPWLYFGLKLNNDTYHDRMLRGMVAPLYCKLWEVGSLENFKKVWSRLP
ncbi:hypothetical protein NMY22_g11967 [Coprinellus aureogranulatus]|nr:hypothetical protein NMY22_g11967 [Coprinellus aureogranulatus]